MYPILFEPFGFPISTFGVMMAVGFLVSAWIVSVRLREYGADPELSSTILIYAMIGGVLGSKLYFAVDESLRSGAPFGALLFSRAGITWYGGLIGGTLLVTLATRIHGMSTRMIASPHLQVHAGCIVVLLNVPRPHCMHTCRCTCSRFI